ncbi:MAG: hypothetical protein KBS75_09130, partial [Bacteroidales bacterium]|nr:hypothetical protein [Candidatus Equimonas faecalis]
LLDAESMEIVNAAQVRMEDAEVSDDDPLFTGIGTVLAEPAAPASSSAIYNLQGQPAAPRHGSIAIQDGRKLLVK